MACRSLLLTAVPSRRRLRNLHCRLAGFGNIVFKLHILDFHGFLHFRAAAISQCRTDARLITPTANLLRSLLHHSTGSFVETSQFHGRVPLPPHRRPVISATTELTMLPAMAAKSSARLFARFCLVPAYVRPNYAGDGRPPALCCFDCRS